jgi:hypothetical protein
MIVLNELIPEYNFLNKTYSNIINKKSISFDEQKFITDFFNKFSNSIEFESSIINSIQESKDLGVLFKSLYCEIEICIEAYKKNKSFFDTINTKEVCFENARKYNFLYNHQLTIVRKYSDAESKANNALEGTAFRDVSEIEIEIKREDFKRKSELYKAEKDKLNSIDNEKRNLEDLSFKYCQNIFNEIHEVSNTKMNILKKYTINQFEDNEYFNMILIAKLYKLSNGILFEKIKQLDFYNEFNLNNSFSKIKIATNQKYKVCYLIYKLYETIESNSKTVWRIEILNKLELSMGYYKSKYKEINRDDADKTLKDFVKLIDNIFDNEKEKDSNKEL